MTFQFSQKLDPTSWDTTGGCIWVGHQAIARAIVRFLGWLERVRLAVRR
jgi:hypothetical protein